MSNVNPKYLFSQWQYRRVVPPTQCVRRGCRLSTTHVNIFLERILPDMLEEHEGTLSIAVTAPRLIYDSQKTPDDLAGSEQELAQLVERLDQKSKIYGMAITAEQTQLQTNNINGIQKEIKATDQKLLTVTNFDRKPSYRM